ncbi:MAG: hydrogenase maturation protease [Anaerolineae bacterium]|nr:hydrogenase maturation protease [Anaerolineae bacterium]
MGSPDSSDEVKHVLILGLGNPLLGDEGIGVRVVEELKGLELPNGVAVVEGGTAGLGLIGLMEGYRRVIIVDAADMGHPPGRVVRFTPLEAQLKTVEAPLSLHQIGLGEVLALAEALEVAPAELVIIGIQPSRVEVGAGLSPEVEGAIPQIIRIILDELDAS